MFTPQPRFRINSNFSDYIYVLGQLASGGYKKGISCQQLETYMAERLSVKHAFCVPQARMGIYLTLANSRAKGKEVILSPNTIADVINMVICAGATPVFCDIDPATGNLHPDMVEKLIGPETAAIMVTHLYGLVSPMARLVEIAQKHDLLLLEDTAQAFGAMLDGRSAGTFGDAGIFSFGMAKNVTSFYGGMVVTNNDEIAFAVRNSLETFPLTPLKIFGSKIATSFIKDVATTDILFPKFLFKIFKLAYKKNIKSITKLIEVELDLSRKTKIPDAYKCHMTPLQARLVMSRLAQVERDFERRLECAHIYYEGLRDIEELTLPPMLDDGSHVYNYFPIGYRDRLSLVRYMMEHNRDIALQHIKNTADLAAFKDFYRDCPNSRKWAAQTIMLPNYRKYRFSEIRRNVEAIRSYFSRRQ